MPRLAALLNLYLVVRIIFCPCLTGQNVHDQATRSLFAWGGAATIASDDLGNPEDRSTEAGACMCDGADVSPCPALHALDRTELPLDPPDDPGLLCITSPFAPGLDRPDPPPPAGPSPADARMLRARLQIYRC